MAHRKKSNYSQRTMHTQQTHKSMTRQSKRKRYPKRVRNPNTPKQNHGPVPPANYRQSSLQIQDHHHHHQHTRSQYSHHTHSHSTFEQSNYKQYRKNHDLLSDIPSDEDQSNQHRNAHNARNDTETSTPEDEYQYTDEYRNEYKQQQQNRRRNHRNNNNNNNNIEQILAAVRREYQQQVDHVISKWKELLDRAQHDVEKYRNVYHSERTHNKKLQQTVHQLRSKLKKYKNKDNENQMIIIDLQQRLNDLYENLTEITTPSYTPKLPLVSPKKLLRQSMDSYYNYSRHSNNKTSLKTSLPPPTQTTYTTHTKRRNSHSQLSIHADEEEVADAVIDEDDDDIILLDKHKIAKTRDDLKKILDTIDNDNNMDSNHNEENGKFISVIIKYKDKLFKNASNTIKVCQGINLNEFVSQLCDSININPQLIQLQHHTNIIDINEKKNMQSSLRQLDIDNFDNIFVYIDYNKLLNEHNQHNENQNQAIFKIFEQCLECLSENKVNNNYNAKNMLSLRQGIVGLNEHCINLQEKECLYAIITNCILQNNPPLMLKLLCQKIAKIMSCQYVRLYFKWNNILQIIYPQNNLNAKQQIIIDLNNNLENNDKNKSVLMDIMKEENEERDFDTNSMKCCNNPSVENIDSTLISPLYFSNEEYIDKQLIGIIQLINKENKENTFEFTFNDKKLLLPFTKIFASAMKILYHLSKQHKIFDAIHRNENEEYNLFYSTRVNRGISRAIYKSQSNSVSKDDHEQLNIITGDMRHNSISRNASPIFYNSQDKMDNLSTTSSAHSQSHSHSTPIFSPMIASPPQIPAPYPIHKNASNHIIHNENMITNVLRRRRNESEQYHHTFLIHDDSDHHQQNSIVLNVSEFKQQGKDNGKVGVGAGACGSISNGNDNTNNSSNSSSNSDENDELLTPPTPTQNYITKDSISV